MDMELLTVQETAKVLRVSEITVRRYIASGRLAAVRVGRGVRVDKEAVESFPTPAMPSEPKQKVRKSAKPHYFTMDDSLWNIVGIGRDKDGATDVSENKYKYLAESYADLHEE